MFKPHATTLFHVPSARKTIAAAVTALMLATAAAPALAQVSEDTARKALLELQTLVTEGTGVVGDLQSVINSGKVPREQVSTEALMGKLRERYQKAANGSLDAATPGLPGEVRRAYVEAYKTVVTKHQGPLTKGGQDAFVPAYFRALVLKEFNAGMKGKLQAYATNREAELINGDSAVQRVMKGSPLMAEVVKAMDGGSLNPVVKRSGDHMLGYWPMKLGASCVSCHAQNGLKQTEGGFGGALVANVAVK